MSKGYVKDTSGAQNLIDNVLLDAGGVVQTLSVDLLEAGGGTQQIFWVAGIPMVAIAGNTRLWEAIDQRLFEATDNRMFEV